MHAIPSVTFEYQVGGSLPVESLAYVTRQADRDLYTGLKAGEFCYVLNSRQMGKSSLRVRTMKRLQAEGVVCAAIDITSIGTADITPEQWYASIIDSIVSSLDLYATFDLESWWNEHSLLTFVQRFGKFIKDIVLGTVAENIVIFVDEIDSILSLKFSVDDFFAVIRDCYNNRADHPEYRRLTFALLGVATPADLIQDKRRTPFNIGRAIELSGFQLPEAQPLAHGLIAKTDDPQAVLSAVLHWTGGQPFLTQKVLKMILATDERISVGEEATWVENLVRAKVLDNWEAHDTPEHLKTIRDRILKSEQRMGRLLGLYQQILHRGSIATDDSPAQMEFRLSGLVVKREGKLQVYNRIYELVFDQAWVDHALAELRPYAEALTAWVQSGYQDESRLLRGQALQDAIAWATSKSLDDLDYHFLGAGQVLDKREVQITLEAAEQEKAIAEYKLKAQRAKTIVAGALASVLALTVFAVRSDWQRQQAQTSEVQALNALSQVKLLSNQQLEALTASIKAARVVQEMGTHAQSLRAETEDRLRTAVYSMQERNQLQGHKVDLWSVSFSPNGQFIASAGYDGTVKLWTVDGRLLQTLEDPQRGGIGSVSFSPNSQMLVSAGYGKAINLWNLNGKLIRTIPGCDEAEPACQGHSKGINSVSFSPDGRAIASASDDKTVKLWSLEGRLLKTLGECQANQPACEGHQKEVSALSFNADGKMIASASYDKTVKLWALDGRLLKTLEDCPMDQKECQGKAGKVLAVSFSPNGQMLATASDNKTVKLWKLDGTLIRTIKADNGGAVNGLSFSRDGQMLATVSDDKTVKIWTIDGLLINTLRSHTSVVRSVSFSPDGQLLASAGNDKVVRLWNVDQTFFKAISAHPYGARSVSFSPNGQLVASTGEDNTVKLWHRDGRWLRDLPGCGPDEANCQGHTDEVHRVVFSPDGQQLASASADKTVKLWKLDGTLVRTFAGHQDAVYNVSFSPDGRFLASAGEDQTINIWNHQGKRLRTLAGPNGHQALIESLSFSPDGKLLASASRDRTIKLWRLDGTFLQTLEGHLDWVSSVSFSPDGQTLASASYDSTIKLWSREGRLLKNLVGHNDWVLGVTFSPDNQLIASASQDNTIKLWSRDGRLLKVLQGHTNQVRNVSFSPDSQILASASKDATVRLWRTNSNSLKVSDLPALIDRGCLWLRDYLQTSSFSESDRPLCDTSNS